MPSATALRPDGIGVLRPRELLATMLPRQGGGYDPERDLERTTYNNELPCSKPAIPNMSGAVGLVLATTTSRVPGPRPSPTSTPCSSRHGDEDLGLDLDGTARHKAAVVSL